MKVLCAMIRPRGAAEWETVAMMPTARRTPRDFVSFRRQVFCSYPGRIEFRFEESEVRRARLIRPTRAENAAILRGIAADPDNPEWTPEDFAQARPFSEVQRRRES
jgi:hypothetical protein